MNEENSIRQLTFRLSRARQNPPEHQYKQNISAARRGRAGGGFANIEDNGFAASDFCNDPISAEKAQKSLERIFNNVRTAPAETTELKDENNKTVTLTGACTAAAAFTTMDGVAWRGAGDSLVVAIGDNGNVKILNKLHVGERIEEKIGEITVKKEPVTNYLCPSEEGTSPENPNDDHGFMPWSQLTSKLGASTIRIAVMSDGVSKSHDVKELEADIKYLLQDIGFNDQNFSGLLSDAANNTDYQNRRKDDCIVLSAKQPTDPNEQALLGAFDGISKGQWLSAKVANMAAGKCEEEIVHYYLTPKREVNPNELAVNPNKPAVDTNEITLNTNLTHQGTVQKPQTDRNPGGSGR